MDTLTHFLVAFLICAKIFPPLDVYYLFFIMIFSSLPDLDVFLGPLQKKLDSYYLTHRAGSHSIIIGVIISPLIGVLFALIFNKSIILTVLLSLTCYIIHLTLDILTTSYIPVLYPITKKEYKFMSERAINFFLFQISFLFIIGYLILAILSVDYIYYGYYSNIILIFYSVYFILRISLKTIISHNLNKNETYLPGLFPFWYYVHSKIENNKEIEIKLFKHSIFKKNKNPIFKSIIPKSSKISKYFLRAEEIAESYRFHKKWKSILPKWQETLGENGEKILIFKIGHAESYTKNRAYSIDVYFNLEDGRIIKHLDGFNTKF